MDWVGSEGDKIFYFQFIKGSNPVQIRGSKKGCVSQRDGYVWNITCTLTNGPRGPWEKYKTRFRAVDNTPLNTRDVLGIQLRNPGSWSPTLT